MDDLISVIVPVFNTKEYLSQCISSVLNQTYNKIELLLIDDASTDGSSELCDYFKRTDERVQVWHLEIQSGVSYSRNLGLKNANGRWISFVDSDDWLDECMYEDLVAISQKTLTDTVCCGAWICKGEKKEISRMWRKFSENEHIYSSDEVLGSIIEQSGTLWGKLFKADIAKAILFDTSLRYGEDLLYLAQYLEKADDAAIIKNPDYFYRLSREGNVVSAKLNDRHLDYFNATTQLVKILHANSDDYVAVERCIDAIVRVLRLVPLVHFFSFEEYVEAARRLSNTIEQIEKNVYIKNFDIRQLAKRLVLIFARKSGFIAVVYSKLIFAISKQ